MAEVRHQVAVATNGNEESVPGGKEIRTGDRWGRGSRGHDARGRRASGAPSRGESPAEHRPVLVDEVTLLLCPRAGGWVVDGTVGMGGHAERLLECGASSAHLLGLDRDPEALARAGERLARFGSRVVLRQGSFRDLTAHVRAAGVDRVAGVLLDLGVSSYQLGASGRGFSFQEDEPLDMRFEPGAGPTAADLLAALEEAELARILADYGDEPRARRIARHIVERRRRAPLVRTGDLVAAVKASVPRRAWPVRTHVATRAFQALRMAVNDEPGALEAALPQAAGLLAAGGRLGVIAFHSGEDRMVKHAFRTLGRQEFGEIEPAPIRPGRQEVEQNPRARSARLRVLERLEAA